MADSDLLALGTKELEQVGLGTPADVIDGCVIRHPKASPVYDDEYHQHVGVVREALEAHCPNPHLLGATACTNTTIRITP